MRVDEEEVEKAECAPGDDADDFTPRGRHACHAHHVLLHGEYRLRESHFEKPRLDGSAEEHAAGVAEYLAHRRGREGGEAERDADAVVDGVPGVDEHGVVYEPKGDERNRVEHEDLPQRLGGWW